MEKRPGFVPVADNAATPGESDTTAPPITDEHLRLLIEAVQDYAIFMLDSEGRISSWNNGAHRIKGYTAAEVIGRSFSIFYTAEDIAAGKPDAELAIAAAQGRVEDDGWRVRRDGSRFWASVIITAIRDASGTLRGFAKVTRDMTERLRLAELEHAIELSAHIQTAREDEQKRIARELHDDLGQQLTALNMDLSLLQAELSASAANGASIGIAGHVGSQMQSMQRQLDATIASLRRIAAGLRPPMLDDLGLPAAIDWLADDFRQRYGLDVKLRLEIDDMTFTVAASTAIFRIVQAALTNVVLHAQATEAAVDIERNGDLCAMRITDNGCGMRLDAPPKPKSFGLLGMRERVRQLHGHLSIDSSPGAGFRILIELPVSNRPESLD